MSTKLGIESQSPPYRSEDPFFALWLSEHNEIETCPILRRNSRENLGEVVNGTRMDEPIVRRLDDDPEQRSTLNHSRPRYAFVKMPKVWRWNY